MLRKIFSFKGRIEIGKFLFNVIYILYLSFYCLQVLAGDDYDFFHKGTAAYFFVKFIFILIAVLLSIIFLSSLTRRSHDLGKSGIDALNPIFFFKLFFLKGDPGENIYGKNPLEINGLVKSGELNPMQQDIHPVINLNQKEGLQKTNIPATCPFCKNPNIKMLTVCEWCGDKIC